MAINTPTSTVENKDNVALKERSPLVENALSRAKLYYTAGNIKDGEKQLEHALDLAKTSQDRISPQEIAYIVNSGNSPDSPVDTRTEKTAENEIPSDIQLVIDAFRRNIEQEGSCGKTIEDMEMLQQDLDNVMKIVQLRVQLLNIYRETFGNEAVAA